MGKEKIKKCLDDYVVHYEIDDEKFIFTLYDLIYEQGIEPSKLIEDEDYLNFIIDFSKKEDVSYKVPIREVRESLVNWLKKFILPCIAQPEMRVSVDLEEKLKECVFDIYPSEFFNQYLDYTKFKVFLGLALADMKSDDSYELIKNIDVLRNLIENSKKENITVIPSNTIAYLISWLRNHILPCISEPEVLEALKEILTPNYFVDVTDKIYNKVSRMYENFYESLGEEAQKSLCLYYTYYLLSLKGNKDFEYEFKTLENRLYDDFYYYGLYSIARELRHVVDKFYDAVGRFRLSNSISDVSRHGEFNVMKEFDETVQRISKCANVNKENIYDITKIYLIKDFTDFEENPKHFLYLLETNFNYISKPEDILNYAISLFEIESDKCIWERGYGGEMWASIAKVIRDRNEYTKTTFVDTCWSLQHNNALWFDKIADSDTIQFLKQLLDDVKDGDFLNAYQCALGHEGRLRREIYKELLGIKKPHDIERFIEKELEKRIGER